MMKEGQGERLPMTMLQRALIAKLRTAGCYQLAELARDAWSAGKRAPVIYRAVDGGKDESVPAVLRADFDRANEQQASLP